MKKTYSTKTAARLIGVSFRTINRWLAGGKIRPSETLAFGGGRTLWRWTDADITKAKKVKAEQMPGPKPKAGAK